MNKDFYVEKNTKINMIYEEVLENTRQVRKLYNKLNYCYMVLLSEIVISTLCILKQLMK